VFNSLSFKDARPIAYLKRAITVMLAGFFVIGMIAGYRAYFQVHSLELYSNEKFLRSGAAIHTTVVSYGRTFVSVRLEIIQGPRSETLAVQRVPKNEYALFDPRPQRASQTVVLTPEMLARFQAGPAQVRATALGAPQWTRVPPPVVRELTVEIQHE
jgi:hypothetical protein